MSELDGLAAAVIRMSDEDLQRTAEAIRGNPKNSTRRRFSEAESVALAAVMAEQARRVKDVPFGPNETDSHRLSGFRGYMS